jgi:hypothetical protein
MFKAGRMAGVVSFFCFAFILNGCATMLAPGADTITIKTIPAGAQVYDGATLLGKTPITHSFKRETFEQKTLTLRLPGYKSQELMLQRSLEKKSLWNFVFFLTTCGATSWGIDALNGNMVMYSPDSYLIDMKKNGAGPQNKDGARWDRIRFAVMNRDNLMENTSGRISRPCPFPRRLTAIRNSSTGLRAVPMTCCQRTTRWTSGAFLKIFRTFSRLGNE